MVSVAIALRAPTPMSFKLRAFTMARRLARRSSSAAERQTTAPDVQGETLACDVSCDSVNGRGPGIARSMRGKRLEFCAAAQGLFCRSRTFWSQRSRRRHGSHSLARGGVATTRQGSRRPLGVWKTAVPAAPTPPARVAGDLQLRNSASQRAGSGVR